MNSALVDLGKYLIQAQYHFTTITPLSHQRYLARTSPIEVSLRDIFGWNRNFQRRDIPDELFALCEAAQILTGDHLVYKSQVRFSTLNPQNPQNPQNLRNQPNQRLFAHSSFPTESKDAVFFGPDTYRFVNFLARSITMPFRRGIDLGCGSGVGGLSVLNYCLDQMYLTDINPKALSFAHTNAHLNQERTTDHVRIEYEESNLLQQVAGQFDLILANPPFVADPLGRAYRDGGGELGTQLSFRIIEESIDRLNPQGKLILYTGAPIQQGVDPILKFAKARIPSGYSIQYSEIDPDIFGEELDCPAYVQAERLAAVGLIITRE